MVHGSMMKVHQTLAFPAARIFANKLCEFSAIFSAFQRVCSKSPESTAICGGLHFAND
jgi:hypothetical protein